MLGLDGLGFGLLKRLNRRFHRFGLGFGLGHLSLRIEQEVQVTHLLLTFLEELVNLGLMLTTTRIWSGLQRQESFLCSEQTLG